MNPTDKPLVWLSGEVKSPPLARCHELRIRDEDSTWRLVYQVNEDVILILDVFQKKTGRTPQRVIATCQQRLRRYDADLKEED